MKATKRSLIVSIAILCVCALSLTSASFAWFSLSNSAKVNNINLSVAPASDLKIHVLKMTDEFETEDFGNYDYTTAFDFATIAAETEISDLSTIDGENFYVPAGEVDDSGAWAGTYVKNEDAASLLQFRVLFRSSSAVRVNVKGENFDVLPAKKDAIESALRMSIAYSKTENDVVNKYSALFSNTTAKFTDKCVGGLDATLDDVDVNPISAKYEIVTLEDMGTDDGYFYSQAIISFYVEGTDENAINDYTGVDFDQNLEFSVIEETQG